MNEARPGLQLPVMAMSLVIPVIAFHAQPGCVGKFLRRHVGHPSGLVNFSAMSGGELQELADALEKHLSLVEGQDYAVIDGMSGPWEETPAVRFMDPGVAFKPWVAFLVEDEPSRSSCRSISTTPTRTPSATWLCRCR